MKSLPEHVKAKGFTDWKGYMASLRAKRGKRPKKDTPPKSAFKPYLFDPRTSNPRPRDKRKPKARFTHERLRMPKKLHHIRTVKVGEHRVIVGCPVPVHRGRCPVGTVAQAILHPRKEGYEFEKLRHRKNPIAVYNPPSQKLPLEQVSIRYRRSSGKYKGDLYEHKFGNSVDVFGIEGGALMIVPKRKGAKLWGTSK